MQKNTCISHYIYWRVRTVLKRKTKQTKSNENKMTDLFLC